MKYTAIDGTEKQTFEGENWSVLEKFVQREVIAHISTFVERISELLDEPFYEFPEFYEMEFDSLELTDIGRRFEGGTDTELTEFIEEIREEQREFIEEHGEQEEEFLAKIPAEHVTKIVAYNKALRALEEHQANEGKSPEIFQYFLVSDYLGNELKKYGHKVCNYESNYMIWGREAFGQSITLDSVISKICIEMEIMEGQKYSWVNKEGRVL